MRHFTTGRRRATLLVHFSCWRRVHLPVLTRARPDAASWGGARGRAGDASSASGRAMSKLYFFNGGQYSRYDIKQDAVDAAYPLPVSGNWSGLPAAGVDAAINWGNGFVYFFAGPQYYRFNTKLDQVDTGSPRPIAGNWAGLTLDAVDACANWGNGKAYFFRGGQYWRYD